MNTIIRVKKLTLVTLLTFICSISSILAQTDTMYVMKDGVIVSKYNVTTEIDSVIFYNPLLNDTSGTFIDVRDGNEYNWIKIGDQVWMAEDLAYLPSVNMAADGSEDVQGSYYYVYGYDGTDVSAAKATSDYGMNRVFYNWTAAMDANVTSPLNPSGVQGVCPAGWHLPSNPEFTELIVLLGGDRFAGGKLKEEGTSNWETPNEGGTNETGFTSLPSGFRSQNGTFESLGLGAAYWTATEANLSQAYYLNILNIDSDAYQLFNIKELGLSIRCVMD